MHRLVGELFERMESAGYSRAAMKRRTGICLDTFWKWKHHMAYPRLDTIEDAGEALGGRLVWVWNEEAPAEASGDD